MDNRLTKRQVAPVALVPAKVTTDPLRRSAGIVVRLSDDVTIELGDVSPVWVAVLIRELARSS